MKHIAHTINRAGELVQGNGFKQAEKPEITIRNHSTLWMHSVERTDSANPIKSFAIFIGFIIAVVIVFTLFGAILK